ncbi:MAG: 8-amino-7-oxononanoate synthase [Planctomycetota bacterium]
MDWITEALAELEAKGLRRRPPERGSPRPEGGEAAPEALDGRTIIVEGREYVGFASNDYLGLAGHERLRRAAADAAARFGAGSGASRLITGTMTLHRELERRLARFKGTEDCVLFTTGYQAGVGAVTSLAGAGDAVVLDKLSHACLIDGARMSGARVRTYAHLDMAKLAAALEKERSARRRLIVTDSLFSMDGDVAPLAEIVGLAREHDAMLLVDEAHATGTTGPGGRGLVAELGVASERVAQMGTLSKALGSVGGFVAGSAELVEYLRNVARSYVYTTAPAPPAVGAALAALDVLESEEGSRLIERLRANVSGLARACPGLAARSAIVPVVVGDAARAVEAQGSLRERGLWVPAVRPPTVPVGGSRLRVSISAAHTDEDISRLAAALRDLGLGQGGGA